MEVIVNLQLIHDVPDRERNTVPTCDYPLCTGIGLVTVLPRMNLRGNRGLIKAEGPVRGVLAQWITKDQASH
jgi:hypothetical protein